VPRGRWRRWLGATGVAKDAGNNLICILQSWFFSGSLTLPVPRRPLCDWWRHKKKRDFVSFCKAHTCSNWKKKISFFLSLSHVLINYLNLIIGIEYIFFLISLGSILVTYLSRELFFWPIRRILFIIWLKKKPLIILEYSRIFFGSEGRKNKPKWASSMMNSRALIMIIFVIVIPSLKKNYRKTTLWLDIWLMRDYWLLLWQQLIIIIIYFLISLFLSIIA